MIQLRLCLMISISRKLQFIYNEFIVKLTLRTKKLKMIDLLLSKKYTYCNWQNLVSNKVFTKASTYVLSHNLLYVKPLPAQRFEATCEITLDTSDQLEACCSCSDNRFTFALEHRPWQLSEKWIQLTLSISNSQGNTEFVRDREISRKKEKNRLQSTQRDRDISST